MVRAKFKVWHKSENENKTCVNIRLSAVYSEDPESENKKFWDYTPSGDIQLSTTNLEAAKYFEINKEYYIDFIEAN